MEMLKDKKVVAALAAVLVLVFGGGAFLLSRNNSQAPEVNNESEVATLSPEDIGMVVTLRSDKRALMFELTKADDIKSVEYVINYEKEIDGEIVPEGILGVMNIAEDGITKTDFREFGTCSAGRCRYDEVVSDVTIDLKVTKKDGKDYQVQKVVKL
jgi:hypothetical protein